MIRSFDMSTGIRQEIGFAEPSHPDKDEVVLTGARGAVPQGALALRLLSVTEAHAQSARPTPMPTDDEGWR